MNETKTPRTLGLYKNWLFDKAGTPYFAAYRGDLMSIAYGIERLESDLAAALAAKERVEKLTTPDQHELECLRELMRGPKEAIRKAESERDALEK